MHRSSCVGLASAMIMLRNKITVERWWSFKSNPVRCIPLLRQPCHRLQVHTLLDSWSLCSPDGQIRAPCGQWRYRCKSEAVCKWEYKWHARSGRNCERHRRKSRSGCRSQTRRHDCGCRWPSDRSHNYSRRCCRVAVGTSRRDC